MILITGGAGYIGRNVAAFLGSDAVLLDDFRASSSQGVQAFKVIESELSAARLDWSGISSIVHCAGSIQVGESFENPSLYWCNNVAAAATFFARVPSGMKVVYSSTAAVYGEPQCIPINEEALLRPINPYGRTKLACEWMLRDLNVELTIFRYFNAAGGLEGHRPETHLIPRLLLAALTGEPFSLYGDGSQIRDFVHVEDLARAHVLAIKGKPGIYNLGSGKPASVREVVASAERVTGKRISLKFCAERRGDPQFLVADISKVSRELGWKPSFTLEDIIESSWSHIKLSGKVDS